MSPICDTSVLLAAFDRSDQNHRSCSNLLSGAAEDLIVPGLVLVELDYWCRTFALRTAWRVFMEDVESGVWRIYSPTVTERRRADQLEQQYLDLDLGIVDASIVALAERLEEPKVATLDRRHFLTVRPAHVNVLRLLPDA